MPRCLIVEDDRATREGYAEYLRSFGFDVDESADGVSAFDLMSLRRPDIVLVDLQMPRVDGFELIRRIRRDRDLSSLRVIAISASVSPDDRARAQAAGCDAFLPKPCSPKEVLAAVMKHLNLRQPPSRPPGRRRSDT
jgi:two-component system cell cycle response regulator DivK